AQMSLIDSSQESNDDLFTLSEDEIERDGERMESSRGFTTGEEEADIEVIEPEEMEEGGRRQLGVEELRQLRLQQPRWILGRRVPSPRSPPIRPAPIERQVVLHQLLRMNHNETIDLSSDDSSDTNSDMDITGEERNEESSISTLNRTIRADRRNNVVMDGVGEEEEDEDSLRGSMWNWSESEIELINERRRRRNEVEDDDESEISSLAPSLNLAPHRVAPRHELQQLLQQLDEQSNLPTEQQRRLQQLLQEEEGEGGNDLRILDMSLDSIANAESGSVTAADRHRRQSFREAAEGLALDDDFLSDDSSSLSFATGRPGDRQRVRNLFNLRPANVDLVWTDDEEEEDEASMEWMRRPADRTSNVTAARNRIQEMRDVDLQSDTVSLRYSRNCGICYTENPRQRAAFKECGHLSCLPCAEQHSLSMEEQGEIPVCPFCRTETGFIRLFEDTL
ncbi:hypothetical protein PFISCL1PPCAC_15969, partial [Pristionchus fissidentatus]